MPFVIAVTKTIYSGKVNAVNKSFLVLLPFLCFPGLYTST